MARFPLGLIKEKHSKDYYNIIKILKKKKETKSMMNNNKVVGSISTGSGITFCLLHLCKQVVDDFLSSVKAVCCHDDLSILRRRDLQMVVESCIENYV